MLCLELSMCLHKGVRARVRFTQHLSVMTNCGGGPYSQPQHTPAWLCSQTNVLTKPTLDFATCLFLSAGARIEAAVRQAPDGAGL